MSAPQLHRRQEFETLLRDYHMSPDAQRVLAQTPFVVMVGLTSTGRNTIMHELIKTGAYHFIISDTTRPPRINDGVWEQNGVEYFFRTEEEMLAEIERGLFIEVELIHNQQVSGVSVRELQKAHDQGKIAITDIEIEGGITIARRKADAVAIALLPPSFQEWLRRIRKRTPVTDAELHRRLQGATKNLRLSLQSNAFVFVINNKLEEAVQTVDQIARLGVHHKDSEQGARQLAEQLYDQTVTYLKEHAPDIKPA